MAYAIEVDAALQQHFAIDTNTGVFSGDAEQATKYTFVVDAVSDGQTAKAYVELTVQPGAAVGVLATVLPLVPAPNLGWVVAPDGTIAQGTVTTHSGSVVSQIPVRQGGSLLVAAGAVDAFGNLVTPVGTQPTVSSSIATDEIAWNGQQKAAEITFVHASTHTITVTIGGRTVSFPVAVTSATATAVSTGGSLAFTGSDDRGLLAWAIGLLVAGGGVLAFRLRRRA